MKRLLLSALALIMTTGAIAQGSSAGAQSVRVMPVPDNELNVRIWTRDREYRVGETLDIYYRTNRDAYVLIFSTSPDGETRQLLPNAYDSDNFVRGGQTYSIPNRGYQLQITPPTGREKLSIVAFSDRNRALEAYSTRRSEAFPKSDGPRAAISRVIVRPDDRERGRGRRYAEDSTTIQVVRGRGDWRDNDRWDNRRGYGSLSINSNPPGAYVYINGQYSGVTPLNMGQVRTGNYDITLNRPGYQPVRRRVNVGDGERERVYENLGSSVGYR